MAPSGRAKGTRMGKIQDTSGTDVIITRRGPKRSTVIAAVSAGVVIVLAIVAYPSFKRWTERKILLAKSPMLPSSNS